MDNLTDEPVRVTPVARSREQARAAYNRMSTWYDLIAGSSEAGYVRAGLGKLAAQPGERVLEIGFGTGHALVSLAEAVGDGGRVTGIDLSEGMAWVAARALENAGRRTQVSIVCGDGARLPFRRDALDAIYMAFTLELFDTPVIPQVLGECRRVLRREGRLCVVSLAKRGKDSVMVRLYEWVHERIPQYVDCRPIPVEGVLGDSGFQIVSVEERSMWGLPLDIVLCRLASLA